MGMFESPKKSKSKSKEPSNEAEGRSRKNSGKIEDDDKESKLKFKVKDSKKLRSFTPEQEEYLLKLSKEVEEEKDESDQIDQDSKVEDKDEKANEEEVKGEIVHRQLVKTAECQEHERIIRRIEEAPKLVKEDTEPEDGEVCSSEMPSDEEKEEEDEERKERLEAVADAKSKLDLIRSELERVREKVS